MSYQIVMDIDGDTRHEFDADDPVALADAALRFRELTKRGYRAVAFNGPAGAPGELTTAFDPKTQKTIFIPQLVGG